MDFGVISLGNHAVTRVIPAIRESGSRISYIYSTDRLKGERISRELGAEYVPELDEFVKKDFDAVYVSSPNSLHFYHAKISMNAGKSVLLEKPVTLNVMETVELKELSIKKGLKLGIGFHLRFHPAVYDVIDLLRNRAIGEPMAVFGKFTGNSVSRHEGTWWENPEMAGGGSVVGRGVHIFDSFVNLFGRDVESVRASSSPSCKVLEDTMLSTFKFANGIFATALSSRAISSVSNDLTIHGSDGSLTVTDFFSTSVSSKLILNGKEKKVYDSRINMYLEEVKDFVNGMQKVAGPEDAVISTKMHLLSQESACSGKTVALI